MREGGILLLELPVSTWSLPLLSQKVKKVDYGSDQVAGDSRRIPPLVASIAKSDCAKVA